LTVSKNWNEVQKCLNNHLHSIYIFSSDEGEREDVGEVHIMDNGYEVHAPSPVIPPSLLAQQV